MPLSWNKSEGLKVKIHKDMQEMEGSKVYAAQRIHSLQFLQNMHLILLQLI